MASKLKTSESGFTQAHDHISPVSPTTVSETSEKQHAQPDSGQDNSNQFNRIPGLQPWRRALIFISLFLGLFLSLMDTSIMATAIYTIALDFNSLAKAFWAILCYQLSYLGFAVVFARSSDFVGRRIAVLTAFVLFVGFSLACGFARNIDQLIAFRTAQGIGGAGLYSLAIILMVEVSTPKLLPLISSFIGGTIAMSGVLGPVLGGVLTEYASWRWIFWINGPSGVIAIACFAIGWPAHTTAYDSSKRKFRDFDFVGAVLILAASILVVFGLQEAGTGQYVWNSSLVLGTLVTGCLCWPTLIAWEYYVHLKHRDTIASMIPFTLLQNRPLLAAIVSTMLTGFSYLLIIVSLPLRFQIVNLRSPASAGVHLLPLLCSTGLGSFLGGTISTKTNRLWQTFVVSACTIAIGVGLLSTLGDGVIIEAKCYGFQIITGMGVGATFSAISMMSAVSSDKHTHSVAQGFASQVRIFGGAIGVATSNAIFNKTCVTKLAGILSPDEIRSLQTNTRIVTTLDAAGRNAVRLAYADSFSSSLRICVYVAVACLVVSAFTWQRHPPMMLKARKIEVEADAQAQAQERSQEVVKDESAGQKC